MSFFKHYFINSFLVLFLTGCMSVTTQHKEITSLKSKPSVKQKKINVKCLENEKKLNYALSYIIEEFNKGYLNQNDFIGAKAQLFLIKNKSESLFAQNINKAERFYKTEYYNAKKKQCNLSKYTTSPLLEIENKIKNNKVSTLK